MSCRNDSPSSAADVIICLLRHNSARAQEFIVPIQHDAGPGKLFRTGLSFFQIEKGLETSCATLFAIIPSDVFATALLPRHSLRDAIGGKAEAEVVEGPSVLWVIAASAVPLRALLLDRLRWRLERNIGILKGEFDA